MLVTLQQEFQSERQMALTIEKKNLNERYRVFKRFHFFRLVKWILQLFHLFWHDFLLLHAIGWNFLFDMIFKFLLFWTKVTSSYRIFDFFKCNYILYTIHTKVEQKNFLYQNYLSLLCNQIVAYTFYMKNKSNYEIDEKVYKNSLFVR